MREELERVRQWANDKLATGEEPPWAWYQYVKLRETLDAILSGMDAVTTPESSQQSAAHRGAHLRLVEVEATDPRDTARPHRDQPHVQLPM